MNQKRLITVGHSPDSDDAFMFYALAKNRIPTGNLEFDHILQDIETLNRRALREELDLTALSVHAYAYVHDRYQLLSCGASIGDHYGPMVVAAKPMPVDQLRSCTIAIPGEWTTAFLVLRLCLGSFEYRVVPFDRILEAVERGEVDAGLIIHEGQLTYSARGLNRILDLGQWWGDETGLPLPLGVNGIRRSLGGELIRQVADCLQASIRYALEHREEALQYALSFSRGLEWEKADRFVGMYVNDWTVDMGETGRQAIRILLQRAADSGCIPYRLEVDFV